VWRERTFFFSETFKADAMPDATGRVRFVGVFQYRRDLVTRVNASAICSSRWRRRSRSKDAIFKNYTSRCGDIPMRERVSDKNEFRSWRAQTPRRWKSILRRAGFQQRKYCPRRGRGVAGRIAVESGTFHLRSSTPVFNSVRGVAHGARGPAL